MDEELRKLIEANLLKAEGGQDVYDKLVNSVNGLKSRANTEKSLGVKTKASLDKLQSSFNDVNASLQHMGFDPESETALDDFLEGFVKKGKNKKKSDDDNSDNDDFVLEDHPAFKKLQKQLTTTTQALDDSNAKVLKSDKDKRNNTIQSTLTSAFKNDKGDYTHYGVESRVENLVLTNKLDINDEGNVFWKDPKDEDGEIDFKEGLKTYLDIPEVKRDLRSTQQGGGGSSSGGGAGGGKVSDSERMQHINAQADNFRFSKTV